MCSVLGAQLVMLKQRYCHSVGLSGIRDGETGGGGAVVDSEQEAGSESSLLPIMTPWEVQGEGLC